MAKKPPTTKTRRPRAIFSDRLAERICNAVTTSEVGLKQLVEADRSLPSVATIHAWRREYTDFGEAFDAARREQAEVFMDAGGAMLDACEKEVRALHEAGAKGAAAYADDLIKIAQLKSNWCAKRSAQLRPKTKAARDDDDDGPWIGDKIMEMPENLDDLIC